MQVLRRVKVGPILVISSVLALWTFLITQHVQAHTPDSPSCSGLPTATDFFDGTNETAPIAPGALTPTLVTKQGTGSAEKGGNTKYRYAKITVPQLAAGELRVFDTRTAGASDAVLCHGTSIRAQHRTSHPSSHNSAEVARTNALAAQTRATTASTDDDITESQARAALNSAAGALISAASALRNAANALRRADNDTAAGIADGVADDLYDTTVNNDDYDDARVAAGHDVNDEGDTNTRRTGVATDNDPADEKTALTAAAGNLGTAAGALRTAADALHNAEAASTVFQLRAEVRPGDQEYILVTTGQDTVDVPTLAVQFNGAIAATTVRRDRSLAAGQQHITPITITTPGLLTVETTGSTDTIGMLDNDDNSVEYAHAESGGSSGNFKFVVPVTAATPTVYDVVVEGQTTRTTGAYTLGMGFEVAMVATGVTAPTGVTLAPSAAAWGTDTDVDDDTMLRIDGSADGDYFLFTIGADSGFLTVNANNDGDGSTKDANTSGTLYGAMGEGPMMEMRAGQIATDADSGPSGHFKFAVPVETGGVYLVEVRGTDGAYELELDFDLVTDASEKITPPTSPLSGELAAAQAGADLDKDLYLFNIEEPGTLYLHSTGTTDVYGILYSPDGRNIAEDDDGGDGMNFNIAAKVAPGLHLLEVTGQNRNTAGVYQLVVSFVAGDVPEPPTEPTTPVEPEPEPEPETDATGALDNPPNNSTRSGVGTINGWVCQAETVTVTITPVGSTTGQSFNIGYGGHRPDTAGACDHDSTNIGFAMAYNFNNLAEGTYDIEARADGELIDQSHRFTVVHLVQGNPFPRNLQGGATILDFPADGQTTTLEWETSSQGFVITDVQ